MKIGRNDPCSCGSGKKYKKCCLLKEFDAEQKSIRDWEQWFANDLIEGQRNLAELEKNQPPVSP